MEENLNNEITTGWSSSIFDDNTISSSTTDSTILNATTGASVLDSTIDISVLPKIASTVTGDYYCWDGPYGNANTISISESLFNNNINRIKIDEILDDVEKFCKEKCFFGLEKICDSDIKCECPLWNRLKCEKRV